MLVGYGPLSQWKILRLTITDKKYLEVQWGFLIISEVQWAFLVILEVQWAFLVILEVPWAFRSYRYTEWIECSLKGDAFSTWMLFPKVRCVTWMLLPKVRCVTHTNTSSSFSVTLYGCWLDVKIQLLVHTILIPIHRKYMQFHGYNSMFHIFVVSVFVNMSIKLTFFLHQVHTGFDHLLGLFNAEFFWRRTGGNGCWMYVSKVQAEGMLMQGTPLPIVDRLLLVDYLP